MNTRNYMIIGALMAAAAATTPLYAQTSTSDEMAQLKQRVEQLEAQVREISQVIQPIKEQAAIESRRKALHEKFSAKMQLDAKKYTKEQLSEAEQLYQVANQKWGTAEANESLQKMIEKFPDINRTGCAVLYLAQKSEGANRAKYLQDCIDKYNDCFYGDGVQVGAYARMLLAQDYRAQGEGDKAAALEDELKAKYAEAVGHDGKLLVEAVNAEK